MDHKIEIRSLDGIDAAAAEFLRIIRGHYHIIAFHAPMGAGKTTFTSAVCRSLGVNAQEVGSPTFSIVNEYVTSSGESLYHFDFYRLNNSEEALDIGLFDYLDSGALCIIEWPENVESLLPQDTLHVSITVGEDQCRTLSW